MSAGLKEVRQCEQWGCLGRGISQSKGPETMDLVRLRHSQGGPCDWRKVKEERVGGDGQRGDGLAFSLTEIGRYYRVD